MDTAKLVFDIVKWTVEVAIRFIAGDDGPEPRRLAEILPPKLRADLEHARQRKLMEEELRADTANQDQDALED